MKQKKLTTIIIVIAIAIVAYLFYKRTNKTENNSDDRIAKLKQNYSDDIRTKIVSLYRWYIWYDKEHGFTNTLENEYTEKGRGIGFEKWLLQKVLWDMQVNKNLISETQRYALENYNIQEIETSLM